MSDISIIGAAEGNLKNISLDIPRNKPVSYTHLGQGEELGNQVGHFAGLVRYGPDAASGFLRGGIFPGRCV